MSTQMPYDERDDSGRFSPRYPREAFIDAIRAGDNGETTKEIAEEVGCGYRTAYDRLGKLEAEGSITSRDVGPTKLWYVEDNDE